MVSHASIVAARPIQLCASLSGHRGIYFSSFAFPTERQSSHSDTLYGGMRSLAPTAAAHTVSRLNECRKSTELRGGLKPNDI